MGVEGQLPTSREPHSAGNDGGAQDCCLKYSSKKIPAKIVRSYRKQEPSLGCPLSAIL